MFWTSDRCSANLLVGCKDVSPQAAQTQIEANRTQWDASLWQQEYVCSMLEQLLNVIHSYEIEQQQNLKNFLGFFL